MTTAFHFLTGAVRVPVTIPAALAKDGLTPFYLAPNDEAWAGTLCRILLHESVHFWQLLAWGYVANVVAEQWRRLEALERTGELPAPGTLTETYLERGEQPFSAYELVECWARYWDVHTRSPARLVEEDGFPSEMVLPGDETVSYTSAAFDRFMQTGDDARLYAAPYRTLLELADGDSHLTNTLFPPLVFAAFGTPEPVRFVLAGFERALTVQRESGVVRRTGNINFDWLNNWAAIRGKVIEPLRVELGMPNHTSGFDVIDRGALGTHPVYAEYLHKAATLSGQLVLLRLNAQQLIAQAPESRRSELEATCDAPSRDRWIVFGLPGHPDYRLLLGRTLPPPRVCFTDATIDASRPMTLRLASGGSETFAPLLDMLEPRIARFDRALKAVSLGLPANAFE